MTNFEKTKMISQCITTHRCKCASNRCLKCDFREDTPQGSIEGKDGKRILLYGCRYRMGLTDECENPEAWEAGQ